MRRVRIRLWLRVRMAVRKRINLLVFAMKLLAKVKIDPDAAPETQLPAQKIRNPRTLKNGKFLICGSLENSNLSESHFLVFFMLIFILSHISVNHYDNNRRKNQQHHNSNHKYSEILNEPSLLPSLLKIPKSNRPTIILIQHINKHSP